MASDLVWMPWSEVGPSLAQYDRAGLERSLLALFSAQLSRTGRLEASKRTLRQRLLRETWAQIEAHTGAWYPGGQVHVFTEQLGDACSCHTFCGLPSDRELSRDEALATSVSGVLQEVDRVHAWLAELDRFYAGVALPTEPAERLVALERAAEDLVDLVILHSETHDCWYPLIIGASRWMAEVAGAAPGGLEDRLEAVVYRNCTSWMPPKPAQRRALHGDIAEIIGG